MKLIYLKGGKNCKIEVVPFSISTLKKWHREGKHPEVVFKLEGQLVFDAVAWQEEVLNQRQACINAADGKKQAAAMVAAAKGS